MPDKKLFLLDALALIYRAHFAFSKTPRLTSKGLNTGAVLGFANTLFDVLKKEQPTHIGVAFDTSAPTFRHEAYPLYKAQREAQPEDITVAIPYAKRLLQAFRIPILELNGFEADDIIGTLAKKAARNGFEVYMMTPDKDYGQLVEEHIFLYKPAFMGNAVEVMGVPEVLAKWDIARIEQVVDMLGLQGDSVDNIPGIPGVGPKTAVKLLADYGSVEGVIAHAHELKGKLQERVREHADLAMLSKELAKINIEVPLPFEEEALILEEPDRAAVKALFEELEFKTLARRVLGEDAPPKATSAPSGQLSLFGPAPADAPVGSPEAAAGDEGEEGSEGEASHQTFDTLADRPHRYYLVASAEEQEELARFLARQPRWCFDTETTSVQALEAELVGMSFSWVPGEAYYVPVPAGAEAEAVVARFRPVLEDARIEKVGQHLKYDILVMRRHGVRVQGPLFDTMVAHYLLAPEQRHKMDLMAEQYLRYRPIPIEELLGKKGKNQGNMRDLAPAEVLEYAAEDADITLQLADVFAPQLQEMGLKSLFGGVEVPLIQTLAAVEANGVKVDVGFLNAYAQELQQDLDALEGQIYASAGENFTINSPKQLGVILFEKLQLLDKPKKTKTGQYATGEEVLVTLTDKHPIVQQILDYRQLQKLKSTYVEALPLLISPTDGLIHTSYNQTVAATGRLSSTDPNLQNIPIRTEKGREIRKAFVPRGEEFAIMSADYSQIELRIMAAFSKDAQMIEAFRQGRDIHTATASRIFKVPLEEVDGDMRRKAKTANFGIIYGISAFGLSQRLNIPRAEATGIIDAYFAEFPAVKSYMDEIIAFAREHEYVTTLLGRRRYLRDINSRNFTARGFAERNAINTPIQGSAADLIKIAMIRIQQWMEAEGFRSKMIMQVHDELVFDAHRDELEALQAGVRERMQQAMDLPVPLAVEIGVGANWLEAH